MVKNGSLTDSSKWNYMNDGRAPRTALGVKADGTLLVYAVDGRQSGYSIGLSQKDLAEEMRDRGCQWVVNLGRRRLHRHLRVVSGPERHLHQEHPL